MLLWLHLPLFCFTIFVLDVTLFVDGVEVGFDDFSPFPVTITVLGCDFALGIIVVNVKLLLTFFLAIPYTIRVDFS